jgi:hypothetical protein
MNGRRCHIHECAEIAEPLSVFNVFIQRIKNHRPVWAIKWRLRFIINQFSKIFNAHMSPLNATSNEISLSPGDTIRIRSRDEIKATLNYRNKLKRCTFFDEMWQYCGTTQRVFKKVEKFVDERDLLMKRCKGIVLLDGIICNGVAGFKDCDKSCFFFWREEWLEKNNEM